MTPPTPRQVSLPANLSNGPTYCSRGHPPVRVLWAARRFEVLMTLPIQPNPGKGKLPSGGTSSRVFWFRGQTRWSSAFRLLRAENMLKHELQQFAFAEEKTLKQAAVRRSPQVSEAANRDAAQNLRGPDRGSGKFCASLPNLPFKMRLSALACHVRWNHHTTLSGAGVPFRVGSNHNQTTFGHYYEETKPNTGTGRRRHVALGGRQSTRGANSTRAAGAARARKF